MRDDEAGDLRVVAEFANEDGGHPYAFTPDGVEALGRERARQRPGAAGGARPRRRLGARDRPRRRGRPGGPGDQRPHRRAAGRGLPARPRGDPRLRRAPGARLGAPCVRCTPATRASPGRTPTRRRWIVAFDDDRDPGATFLFDRETGESELLFRSRPWLDPATLAPMAPVRITSRDGLHAAQLPHPAPRRGAAGPARPCSSCTAARGRATPGATTRRRRCSPTAATPCCRSTTAAPPASASRSPTPPSASSPGRCTTT